MLMPFFNDKRGSISAAMGLSTVMLVGAVGGAFDYSRMTERRASLAAAVDAAAIAAAQASSNDVTSVARQVFDANYRDTSSVTSFAVNKVTKDGNDLISIEATADVRMSLAQVIGMNSAPVRAVSEVVVGSDADVQLALVLDVTGSMSGTKINHLMTAASNMVNTLFDKLQGSSQLKIAVVPFAEYVNVGESNRNAVWIDAPAPQTKSKKGKDICDGTASKPGKCKPELIDESWDGCVGSRNYPLNVQDGNYAISRAPAVMDVSCPPELTLLTPSRPKVLKAISDLSAGGATYIPAGLTWGWATLSPETPFSEPTNANRKTMRYLVLMTDGENTRSPAYPKHDNNDVNTSNSLTAELCTNIKAAGIEIFTISFELDDNLIKNLLRACASSSEKYFDATGSTELNAAFNGITKQMTELRRTK